jgi:hypothetical protein
VSVTGAVLLMVLAVKRSALLIFGFCTGEISGLTVAVGSEVVWLLVNSMLWVVPPGIGTATVALWQTRKVRLQLVGNGSLYCTVPASTSVVKVVFVEKGGFAEKQGGKLKMLFGLVQMRLIGFEIDTFGPPAEIWGSTER